MRSSQAEPGGRIHHRTQFDRTSQPASRLSRLLDYTIPDAQLSSMAKTIAEDIAAALKAVPRLGARPIYQANTRAYVAYQRGRFLADRRDPSDLQLSLKDYDEAIKLDPGYAEAWAGMADSYSALGTPPWGALRPMEARVRAREAAEKALSINPNLAEAETSLAWELASFSWDWSQAETRFKRAISLNPQYALAHHWYSMLLSDLGRFDEARAELRQAETLQPESLLIHRDFGWIDFSEGRLRRRDCSLQQTLAPGSELSRRAITLLARSLAASGQTAQGLAELERAKSTPRGDRAISASADISKPRAEIPVRARRSPNCTRWLDGRVRGAVLLRADLCGAWRTRPGDRVFAARLRRAGLDDDVGQRRPAVRVTSKRSEIPGDCAGDAFSATPPLIDEPRNKTAASHEESTNG